MRQRRDIVAGQPVRPEKAAAARRLRRESTPAELAFWEAVRGGRAFGLKFRRQQVIDGFVVDFYCACVGLVVELDGPVHEGQRDADADRDRVLTGRGLRVLRFPNARVIAELPAVVAEVERAGKATSPPGPLSETERGSESLGAVACDPLAPLSASERGRG